MEFEMRVKEFSDKYFLSIETVRVYITNGTIDGVLLSKNSYVVFSEKTNKFLENRITEIPDGWVSIMELKKICKEVYPVERFLDNKETKKIILNGVVTRILKKEDAEKFVYNPKPKKIKPIFEKSYYSSLKEMVKDTIYENMNKIDSQFDKPVKSKRSLFNTFRGKTICI
jgi:hypothetical protein